ncbi:MAG: hypothetical protein LBC92_00055, partial [Rickettsiales bacterium]|nr:hypothetical protein [Rickettsiales bacterium]
MFFKYARHVDAALPRCTGLDNSSTLSGDCEIYIDHPKYDDGESDVSHPFFIGQSVTNYVLNGNGKSITLTYNIALLLDYYYPVPKGGFFSSEYDGSVLTSATIKNITFKNTSIAVDGGAITDLSGATSRTIFGFDIGNAASNSNFALNLENVAFSNNSAISSLFEIHRESSYSSSETSISFQGVNFTNNTSVKQNGGTYAPSLFAFRGIYNDSSKNILKTFLFENSSVKGNTLDGASSITYLASKCGMVSLFSFCKDSDTSMTLKGSEFTIKNTEIVNNSFKNIGYNSTEQYISYGSFFIKGIEDSKIILENVIIKNNEATGTTPAYMKLHSLILLSVTQNDVNSP